MSPKDMVGKVRDHLGKARARALIMANAQSAIHRGQYLKELSAELEKAQKILDKLATLEPPSEKSEKESEKGVRKGDSLICPLENPHGFSGTPPRLRRI